MNEWERVSLLELATENGEMLRMFHRILNSPSDITSIISPIIIPYLALLAEGNNSLIGGAEEYPEINGKSYKKIIEKTRLRAKIYSGDRLASSIKHIEANIEAINHDLPYDYNFFQRTYIKLFGQKTLGLNTYKETPIFSNFLGYSYLSEFFEIDDFKQVEQSWLRNEDIGLFANYSSNYILQVVSGMNIYLNEPIVINDNSSLDIALGDLDMKDYLLVPKEKQTFFSNDNVDLSVSIFILDILCTINFVKELLPSMIDSHSSLYFRIKLITYVSAVESIDKLSKGFNRQTGSEVHIKEITSIVEKKRKLISQDIRNNLFHFSILEKDIPIDELDVNNIFFSLIEFKAKMSFSEFGSVIDSELKKVSSLVNRWIL